MVLFPLASAVSNVLVISSYDVEYEWSQQLLAGVREIFDEADVPYYVEYLDTKYTDSPEYLEAFARTIHVKYQESSISLIIAFDDNALSFVLDIRSLFPEAVPVVFNGINDFSPEMLEGVPMVTGVIDEADESAVLKTSLKLHPETENIVIVHDQTESGLANARRIRRSVEQDFPNYSFIYLTNMSFTELSAAVQKLPPSSIIFYRLYIRDSKGAVKGYSESLAHIAGRGVPVYQGTDIGIGSTGSAGGFVLSPKVQGRETALLALEVFDRGTIEPGEYRYIRSLHHRYDYQVLSSFSVPVSKVPEDAVLVNTPDPLPHSVRITLYLMSIILLMLVALVITLVTLFSRQKRDAEIIARNERMVRLILEISPFPLWIYDLQGILMLSNRQAEHLFSLPMEEGSDFFTVLETQGLKENATLFQTMDNELLKKEKTMTWPARSVATARGMNRIVLVSKALLDAGGTRAVITACADITEERRAAEQLQQSEKMKAIGLLAGGIAHDFNNQLTVIHGYSDMLDELNDHDELQPFIEQVKHGVSVSMDLTRQLLSYAREEEIILRPLSVVKLLKDTEKQVRASMNKGITIRCIAPKDGTDIKVSGDAVLLQNALLNLALNARDAMDTGGVLTLQVDTAEIRPEHSETGVFGDIPPGTYGRISVTDTGSGIPEKVKASIFDPFFSTKPEGKGTGLGLSAVAGTVSQHGGYITLESAPGEGSTFSIYLPLL